jgi:hypothetical protein
MIIEKASYWFILSFLYLCYFVYKDLTNNMLVDDRKNYFMKGATAGLIGIFGIGNFWYLFVLILGTSILGSFLKKKNALGEADISTLIWLFYGFGILGIQYYTLFVVVFLGLTALFFLAKYLLARAFKKDINIPVPFYPVILGSFLITVSRMLYLAYA